MPDDRRSLYFASSEKPDGCHDLTGAVDAADTCGAINLRGRDIGQTWTGRTPLRISSTGVDRSTPISTQIHSGIRKNYTPASSDSTGTRIPIGISGTSTFPLAGYIWSPWIRNKRQSASPTIIKSNKLDAAIDGKFTNNPVALPIFTKVFSDKLSNNYIPGLYARVGMHLAKDPANPVTTQFLDHGLSTVDVLNKGAGIWSPSAIVKRCPEVAHWSAKDHAVVKSTYNYKIDFEIWRLNLQFERQNIARSQPLDSNPVGYKT